MINFEIGGSSYRKKNLEQEFKLMKESGFDYIEIDLGDPIIPSNDTFEKLKVYNSILPIKAAHLTDIVLDKEDINKKLAFVKILGNLRTVKLLVLHWHSDYVDTIHFFDKIEILSLLNRKAAEYNITVALENTNESAGAFDEVFKYVPEVSMTLDVGHANLYGAQNRAKEFISYFASRIVHVHFHDNFGGDSPDWDLHLPIGVGSIDFEEVIIALKGINYKGAITLEIHCDHREYSEISRKKLIEIINKV